MRKLFLFLTFILTSLFCLAQIENNIKVEDVAEKLEYFSVLTTASNGNEVVIYITHYFDNDTYYLYVPSNNRFENTKVEIKLGVGAEQALESLNNLQNIIKSGPKMGGRCEIAGYSCGTTTMFGGGVTFLNTGKLQNTAGDYLLRVSIIKSLCKKLQKK